MNAQDTAVAQHYSTAIEGNAAVSRRYTITGQFDSASYAEFIADRAHWLAIEGWVEASVQGTVQVMAAGPEALVGAPEMACLLGPLDALVETIEAVSVADGVGPGFAIR